MSKITSEAEYHLGITSFRTYRPGVLTALLLLSPALHAEPALLAGRYAGTENVRVTQCGAHDKQFSGPWVIDYVVDGKLLRGKGKGAGGDLFESEVTLGGPESRASVRGSTPEGTPWTASGSTHFENGRHTGRVEGRVQGTTCVFFTTFDAKKE